MKALFATSEIFPFNKTGGLGDVSAWLPPALKRAGVDVRYIIPACPQIMRAVSGEPVVAAEFGKKFHSKRLRLLKVNVRGNPLKFYLLDAPELFARDGNPYSDSLGNNWGDNHVRFAALSWAAAQFALGEIDGFTPDVIHANDWMTGLAPAYLEVLKRKNPLVTTSSVLTIHNIAFQGLYPYNFYADLDLPNYMFNEDGAEFWQQVSFLKAGIMFADKLTTVSPTYAAEIQTPEYGCGLEGSLSLRRFALTGILNGVDYDIWNPETDKLIATTYSKNALGGKKENKAALQELCRLAPNPRIPLFALVSRLTEQKGIDILIEALPALMLNNVQLAVMGADQGGYYPRLASVAKQYPEQLAVMEFDEELSHQVIAGADVFINPARFEPCGLTQMFAMKYGTIPYARRTGGLVDTIVDATFQNVAVRQTATGFLFDKYATHDFVFGISRILSAWRGDRKIWESIRRQGMIQNFSWDNAAAAYLDIYSTQMELGT